MKLKRIIYLSYLIMFFISINLLFKMFFFISVFFEKPPTDGDLSPSSLFPNNVVNTINITNTSVSIILIVLFLFWVYGINKRLHLFKIMSFSPLWSALWFIVPIASFYKPYYVIEDIWVESTDKRKGFVKLWWFFVLFSTFLGKFIFNLILRLFNANKYYRILISYTITDALGIIMFVLTIILIINVMKGYINIINSSQNHILQS